MGKYSKTLSKRLRQQQSITKHDFNFTKVCFKEKWSREEWYRLIQVDGGETADEMYDDFALMEHWVSDDYWVMLDKQVQLPSAPKTFQDYPLWHLMITRHDKTPCHDWQVFQTIKNEIVGPQYEAVEIYPAQSRLMDRENKYHLWILGPKDNEDVPPRFKIGSKSGKVKTVVCEEKYLKGHVAEIQETLDRGGSIAFAIFPDSLRSEVEKEFPGVDYGQGMERYIQNHPELELELFEPQ
jgi:hypothetical protein